MITIPKPPNYFSHVLNRDIPHFQRPTDPLDKPIDLKEGTRVLLYYEYDDHICDVITEDEQFVERLQKAVLSPV